MDPASETPPPGAHAREDEKDQVAMSSVTASVLLLVLKLVVGLQTGSLGILSEAAHSALDFVSAALTVWAVRAAREPADDDHHFGHGKFENVSALAQTGLLLATCYWIVAEAIERLQGAHAHPLEPGFWAYVVMGTSIAVDWSRSRALKAAAEKYNSQALEADALHFSTDILSSAMVIVGLACTQIGQVTGRPWLTAADPIAALAVAVLVLLVSLRLGKRTVDALVDRAPISLPTLERHLLEVPEVLGVDRIRVRNSGSQTFVELSLQVDRNIALTRSEAVSSAARRLVEQLVPEADVVVQIRARSHPDETVEERVRAIAGDLKLAVHNIVSHAVDGGHHLDLHLEVDRELSLKAAHDLATPLEERIRHEMPRVRDVVLRLEGRRIGSWTSGAPEADVRGLRDQLATRARAIADVVDCRDLVVMAAGHQLAVTCRCLFADELSVDVVNRRTVEVEHAWRAMDPRIGRITIHQEPASIVSSFPKT